MSIRDKVAAVVAVAVAVIVLVVAAALVQRAAVVVVKQRESAREGHNYEVSGGGREIKIIGNITCRYVRYVAWSVES